ncbi:MAG: phosphate-starvation-inducible PsiE family protein [Microthrixaceae bacterium]
MQDEEQRSRALARLGDTLLMYAEMAIYVVISAALVIGAVALLGDAVISFFRRVGDDGVLFAATQMLSMLLLVFVFVELLGAVRSTVSHRRLVAEPFLLVGIIAAIKEIVLIGGTERSVTAPWPVFRNAMIEMGVLALVVLALAVATVLLRTSSARRAPVVSSGDPAGDPDDEA